MRAVAARCGKPMTVWTYTLPSAFGRAQAVGSGVGDLLDWALSIAKGKEEWHNSTPLPWDQEAARFFGALERLDAYLASDEPLGTPPEQLFQGPIADALTHIGQISMLRRLAGSAVRGENYHRAAIAVGRVGADQTPPGREFD